MKTLVIYHEVNPGVACPDGIAAAWVARKFFKSTGTEPDFLGLTYQREHWLETDDYEHLCIVDFSFPQEMIDTWVENGLTITLIDHHKTAEKDLGKYLTGNFSDALQGKVCLRFDMAECGATLAWKYFFGPNKPMPVFLKHVKDRDLWEFKLDYTQEIHESMAHLKRTFENLDRYENMTDKEFYSLMVPLGTFLLQPKRDAITAAATRVEYGNVAGHENIPLVRLSEDEDRLTSDICHVLYKNHPEHDFVACLKSNGYTWSLRSDKDGKNTDVAEIAKANGGGGHRNAAGFLDQELVEDISF